MLQVFGLQVMALSILKILQAIYTFIIINFIKVGLIWMQIGQAI